MIPKGKGLPRFADEATLNQIRGEVMVGRQTIEDVWTLLDHIHACDDELSLEAAEAREQIARMAQINQGLEQALYSLADHPLPSLPRCWCEEMTIGDEGQVEHDARCRDVEAALRR